MPISFDLYLVVSGGDAELERAIRAVRAAPGGRLAVQARWKDASSEVVLTRTAQLLEASTRCGAPVLVSGRPDLARAAGAAGVHLPHAAMCVSDARVSLAGGGVVGTSCHDAASVFRRIEEGADFVTLGPVGDVPGKNEPLSSESFQSIATAARAPVFALGGVRSAAEVERVLRLGAHGVAVARAITSASDPARSLDALLRALDAARA